MSFYFKKISIFCLLTCFVVFVIFSGVVHFSSANNEIVGSGVYVAVCGNEIIEGGSEGIEECDDGKHCDDTTSCSSDAECAGVGDELCLPRSGDGCSSTCKIVSGGGVPPQPQNIVIADITAHPEQRSGSVNTNYDTDFTFFILNPDDQNHQVIYQYPSLFSANNSGVSYVSAVLSMINEGTYDVAIKTESHLSKVLDNIYLYIGDNSLNFTDDENSSQIGQVVLTAGDINRAGSAPDSLGDDVINAIDLSILLNKFGSSDFTGNSIRANLNQDSVVDETDLNILLGNLDKEGDI